ncbi:MAG: aspartate/glutamate racemase family protein, partial [Aggregatilineales bacterium]
IPLIHIADATAEAITARNLQKIALLGTRFTMEKDFYKGRLIDNFGLDVRVPDEPGRKIIHDVVYEELIRGILKDDSRRAYQNVIQVLADEGAEGVILGCTEIGLLIKEKDSPIPTFDTTELHALAAVEFALA